MRPLHSQKAFTLAEIVVVLAILGISATVVSMNLRGPLRHARVNSAIQTLLSVDQFARNESKKCDVILSLENKDSCLASLMNKEQEAIRAWALPRTVQVHLAGESTIEQTTITYSQVGGSRDLIMLVSEGDYTKKLCIAGATGHSIVLLDSEDDI